MPLVSGHYPLSFAQAVEEARRRLDQIPEVTTDPRETLRAFDGLGVHLDPREFRAASTALALDHLNLLIAAPPEGFEVLLRGVLVGAFTEGLLTGMMMR